MRRADIEVPNPAVAVDAWAGSACYPQGSFYPISYGPSTRRRRITKADFRPCAAGLPCSQAPLCLCTRPRIAIPREGTVARLRYLLGGDRPSQTTHQPRSPVVPGECAIGRRVVFQGCLPAPRKGRLTGSHLCYAAAARLQWQAVEKLHGVFLSCYGLAASSPPSQFHRAPGRDTAQIVMPFVRVGTYPTRNFATLGLL